MGERTNRKTMAVALALLAVVGDGAWADERDLSKPGDDSPVAESVDPADYRDLDGSWSCRFLNYKGRIERDYYSSWTFDRKSHRVDIFWSPVHKGVINRYRWDGKQLVLSPASPSSNAIYSTHKTQILAGPTLVIEDPRFRWKGWRCTRQPGERWPADGLQFLDYARYPWLSGLIEDGHSIMKYRDPEQYREWLKGAPR